MIITNLLNEKICRKSIIILCIFAFVIFSSCDSSTGPDNSLPNEIPDTPIDIPDTPIDHTGTNPVTLTPGLYAGSKTTPVLLPVNGKILEKAFEWIFNNGVAGGNYLIVLGANEAHAAINSEQITTVYGVTLTLQGDNQEHVIQLVGTGSLYTLWVNKFTLVLANNISLKGVSNNDMPLVLVNSSNSKLIMKAGSKIQNNIHNGTVFNGGGVCVYGGEFEMNGGEIFSNSSQMGGGVFIYAGKFTMKSGRIYDNTATNHSGGGVYLINNAQFTMENGEISNNSVSTTADCAGGGVYVNDSVFLLKNGDIYNNKLNSSSHIAMGGGVFVGGFSSFTMEGGNIYKNTITAALEGYGGGVFGNSFTKTGGTITGYGNNTSTGNRIISTIGGIYGHTICKISSGEKYINNDVGPSQNLDSSNLSSPPWLP